MIEWIALAKQYNKNISILNTHKLKWHLSKNENLNRLL